MDRAEPIAEAESGALDPEAFADTRSRHDSLDVLRTKVRADLEARARLEALEALENDRRRDRRASALKTGLVAGLIGIVLGAAIFAAVRPAIAAALVLEYIARAWGWASSTLLR